MVMDIDFDSVVQKQLDAAMPWVGLYIAAASAVCTLAMAADAVSSYRHKKLCFPCRYSSFNAASLTVLAVAMKLPMDLNTVMIKSDTDAAAKFMSLFFMSTIVTNFMPSLGSMNDKELLANVVGLGILVITITGNVGIQFIELRSFLKPGTIILFVMTPSVLMLVSFMRLVSLAITVSTIKRRLKFMHQQKLKEVLMEDKDMDLNMDDQRRHMIKYLVMAESCNPQFVMARSVVCTASYLICWLSTIILFLGNKIRGTNADGPGESSYKNYTRWIVYVQSIGIAIGMIVAILRWFVAVVFRCSKTNSNSFRKELLNTEDYWIQTLTEWRNSLSGLQIRPNRFMKYLHHAKWYVFTLCIGIQIWIVLVSNMIVVVSAFILRPFLSCFSQIRYCFRQKEHASGDDTVTNLNLSRYVLLLEGEAELPTSFMKSMRCEADRMIQEGRRQRPSSLLNLLQKSVNFKGVGEFNSSQIPSLVSQDPPDCWTLPVVTLTTISLALPNISQDKQKQLVSSVKEGLSLAKIVEKTLDTSGQLKSIRKVARVIWVEVLLYSKWLETDLRRAFLNCKSAEEVLCELSDKAEEIVMEFKREGQVPIMENPLNLPVKVVAANSMFRICQSMLVLSSGEEMMERITEMIADILAACLTNMPCAITKMCHQNSMEKRERSVREAFMFLGKAEQVIELVRKRERPSLDHEKLAYIEEWRAFFQQNGEEAASGSTSTDESGGKEHLAVILD